MRGVRPRIQTRRGGAVPLAVAVAAALLASCTFLVSFDDVDGGAGACDGGLCLDAKANADVDAARPDVVLDTLAEPEVGGGDDAPIPDDVYAPCENNANGYYCAHDGLHGYLGSPNDLVYCQDGGIGKVTDCDAGCLPLPSPFPDACNPCGNQPDGTYCGRDLSGFPATDADFLLQCQSGNAVQTVACAHGCDSKGTMSTCYP